MNPIKLNSQAKLNLFLSIGSKLENGFHEINSIFHQINLHDKISIKKIDENKTIIKSNIKEIENEDNLSFKAASLLRKNYGINEGVEINIDKKIPLGAGLGGGSSNAASTIIALNNLFNLNLNKNKLMEFASKIGSDVPFFVEGKTCFVSGIGDKIERIDANLKLNFVIIKPDIEISTKWAYDELDQQRDVPINNNFDNNEKIKKLISNIKNNDIKKIAENLHNDFEPIIFKKYPIIKTIKNNLIKNNALNALLTGSGSAVFGIFEDKEKAKEAYSELKEKYPSIYLTQTF